MASFCIFPSIKKLLVSLKKKTIAVFEALQFIRSCIQMYTYKFISFILFKDFFLLPHVGLKLCIIPSMQRLLALQWPWKQCKGFLCVAYWLLSVLFRYWCFYQLRVCWYQKWWSQYHHCARRRPLILRQLYLANNITLVCCLNLIDI